MGRAGAGGGRVGGEEEEGGLAGGFCGTAGLLSLRIPTPSTGELRYGLIEGQWMKRNGSIFVLLLAVHLSPKLIMCISSVA